MNLQIHPRMFFDGKRWSNSRSSRAFSDPLSQQMLQFPESLEGMCGPLSAAERLRAKRQASAKGWHRIRPDREWKNLRGNNRCQPNDCSSRFLQTAERRFLPGGFSIGRGCDTRKAWKDER